MGILSAKRNGNRVKISFVLMVLNLIKATLLVVFKKKIFAYVDSYGVPSFGQVKFSPFSLKILRYHAVQPIYHAVVVILLQLLLSFRNVQLINQMLNLRYEFICKFSQAKKVYVDYESCCKKHFWFLTFITAVAFAQDFFLTRVMAFGALLSHTLFNIPYFVNMLFIYYNYVIILFIVFSQKALILYSLELRKQLSSRDMETIVNDIFCLRLSLYSIKEYYISTLIIPLLLEIFDFVSEAMFEVSLKFIKQ